MSPRTPKAGQGSATGAKRGRPSAPRNLEPLGGRRSRDQEVVETAVRLFSENGYAATSVRDIADALGMLKGSLYYYIDTKETLLRKIFETSHEQVQEIAERHRTGDAPPVERLHAFLEEYALWYLTHLQRAILFAREWRHASDDLRETMAAQRRYYDDVVEEMIQAIGDAGELDPELDTKLATYFVMSAVSSLPDWYKPKGRQSPQAVAKRYADMAIKMFVAG
ncbi:TetR/AcrR family transcriptional regulator [Streptomyces sp. NPDC058001]|uniref:TetR/AcrR family transcriptional regulator n=1 Tax=Streptomyces sp. NPDC058001 TaxID=3346300 RepID=UPI0036E92B26